MSEFNYPPVYAVKPLEGNVSLSIRVPGSKSITNRAMILAALLVDCTVTNVLRSEDTEVMVDSLRKLEYDLQVDWDNGLIQLGNGTPRIVPAMEASLFVANSGTSIRFLTALCAFGMGTYRLDGIPRMRERPIGDLLDALKQLGVDTRSEAGNGCPPVVVHGGGLRSGHVRMKANVSSQYVSAMLMVLPFLEGDSVLELEGEIVSEPYIDMTVRMLCEVGSQIRIPRPGVFEIKGRRQIFAPYRIDVEPDASSASYFFAAAAIAGGLVTVEGLVPDSMQGDVHFVDALERMGCEVVREKDRIHLTRIDRYGPLRGIDIDMNAISDTVMTLAAVACFAEGPTTIRNVAHIRHKETDRIHAVATELRKAGIRVDEREDGLTIHPGPISACAFDTYNDHRMAMSLALLGLRADGIEIKNPGCVAKTYPGFWKDFERLYETTSSPGPRQPPQEPSES